MPNALPDRDHPLFASARSGRRRTNPVLAIVLTIVFFAAGLLVLQILGGAAAPPPPGAQSPLPAALGLVVGLAVAFLPALALLWLWLRFFERRPFRSVGFTKPNPVPRLLVGVALGVLGFGLVVALLALLGAVEPEVGPASGRSVSALAGILVMLVAWTIQASTEEVVVRGWLFPVVGARHGALVAVAVSSLLFAALHLLNPGSTLLSAVNVALAGAFLALYALREGGLWGVCGFHIAWNWAAANLFGFPVSGQSYGGGALFDLRAAGPDLLTGGAFGPEGGLGVTLVFLLGAVVLVRLLPRR